MAVKRTRASRYKVENGYVKLLHCRGVGKPQVAIRHRGRWYKLATAGGRNQEPPAHLQCLDFGLPRLNEYLDRRRTRFLALPEITVDELSPAVSDQTQPPTIGSDEPAKLLYEKEYRAKFGSGAYWTTLPEESKDRYRKRVGAPTMEAWIPFARRRAQERVAKALADHIGHGMREKCMEMAAVAIKACCGH